MFDVKINGEAIYGIRPWKIFSEGPTQVKSGMFNENQTEFTARDFRFTKKDGILYAFMMGWPEGNKTILNSMASGTSLLEGGKISDIKLFGSDDKLIRDQDEKGLKFTLPEILPNHHAVVFKIIV
jgi:alpha-L-fucosidase